MRVVSKTCLQCDFPSDIADCNGAKHADQTCPQQWRHSRFRQKSPGEGLATAQSSRDQRRALPQAWASCHYGSILAYLQDIDFVNKPKLPCDIKSKTRSSSCRRLGSHRRRRPLPRHSLYVHIWSNFVNVAHSGGPHK